MKALPNYEGIYSMTEEGKLWSHRREKFLTPGKCPNGYLTIKGCFSKSQYVHRLMGKTFLNLKDGQDIDHLDRNRSNNNLANLRVCSRGQNLARRTTKYRYGFRGIMRAATKAERWIAQFKSNPKDRGYLGTFATKEDAARAYDYAAKAKFGEFASLNFP